MRVNDLPHRSTGFRPRTAIAVVATLLVALVALAGCAEDGGDDGPYGHTEYDQAYVDISPDELATMLENKDFLLINTHIPYEGDIPETDMFIPYDEAGERVDQLPEDRSAKIVVYCRSDNMSRQAGEVWADAGYTNLYNLEGGFVAWRDAGYEMVRNDW